MNERVVTLGELMLRLSTPGFERLEQATGLRIHYGGAEANVAANLANFGLQTTFVTRLPENALGRAACGEMRKWGVDTSQIAWGGNRLGIYFLETGSWARPSRVVYDRAFSAFAGAEVSQFDFDQIFDGATWFHTTGITPALGDGAVKLTETALIAAKRHGVKVSFDMNYRQNLWDKTKAGEVLTRLCQYVDVYIGNIGHAELLLGVDTTAEDRFEDICNRLIEKFDFECVACTLRDSYSASRNDWSAMVYDGTELYKTREYEVDIVDRVGSGDSFAAGLIYGFVKKMDLREASEFGVAASALKHTIPGDVNLVSIEEVRRLMGGDVSGKVVR